MGDFEMKCPHCESVLQLSDEWNGYEVQCPVCGKIFAVTVPQHQSIPTKTDAGIICKIILRFLLIVLPVMLLLGSMSVSGIVSVIDDEVKIKKCSETVDKHFSDYNPQLRPRKSAVNVFKDHVRSFFRGFFFKYGYDTGFRERRIWRKTFYRYGMDKTETQDFYIESFKSMNLL